MILPKDSHGGTPGQKNSFLNEAQHSNGRLYAEYIGDNYKQTF